MVKTINLNTGEGYTKIVFPDSQPHINLEIADDEFMIRVICSIDSPAKLLELCLVANAIDNTQHYSKDELHITYLMGARYDRIINKGDSFDLKVISKIINDLDFQTVFIYDPHSDVSTALINNSQVVDNKTLVQAYNESDATLIIPDAGAAKKAHKYSEWNDKIVRSVQCLKTRNLFTGAISLEILSAEKCAGKNCVIIDDICDGGGTFLAIARELIVKSCKPKTLILIVTHGVFSKGVNALAPYFDQIICSDSLGVYEATEPPVKHIAYDPNKYGIGQWAR